jgi:hypothetical protein
LILTKLSNDQFSEFSNMKPALAALALLLLLTSTASAAITGGFVVVPGNASSPANTVTNDLLVEATTDWMAANLIIELTQGSIHQDALIAGIGPPSPALVGAIPALAWDTYVTGPQGLAGGAPSSAGGAVDLGGTSTGTFDGSLIDVNWFNVADSDTGTFTLGRFTFSNDARGSFTLRLDAAPLRSAPFLLSGRLINGTLTLVPEPSSLVLTALGCGLAAIAMFRRRSTLRAAA